MDEIEIVVTQDQSKARVYLLPFAEGESVERALDRLAKTRVSAQFSADSVIAIHGQVVKTTTKLRKGDRVEVLQSLVIDPKEARRQRAHSGRKKRLKKPHSTTSSSSVTGPDSE